MTFTNNVMFSKMLLIFMHFIDLAAPDQSMTISKYYYLV